MKLMKTIILYLLKKTFTIVGIKLQHLYTYQMKEETHQ